jgi:hypothetical protein
MRTLVITTSTLRELCTIEKGLAADCFEIEYIVRL